MSVASPILLSTSSSLSQWPSWETILSRNSYSLCEMSTLKIFTFKFCIVEYKVKVRWALGNILIFVEYSVLSPTMKEFWKLSKICQSYRWMQIGLFILTHNIYTSGFSEDSENLRASWMNRYSPDAMVTITSLLSAMSGFTSFSNMSLSVHWPSSDSTIPRNKTQTVSERNSCLDWWQ